jgi:NAD(P)-dependent dehydrogenase (short-subunit alcohol dehydrogenase family)
MSETTAASELLRPGLLEGISVLLAGAAPPPESGDSPWASIRSACEKLGARVSVCELAGGGSSDAEEAAVDQAVERALAERGSLDLLVLDGGGLFAAAFSGDPPAGEHQRARAALRGCLQASWSVTRAVANQAFLARERGGRVIYLAPVDAGEHADAARAGLENLARTLSVEWARHSITVVTIAPGPTTTPGELAALSAYLASPAGAYFSGCLLDLRGPATSR